MPGHIVSLRLRTIIPREFNFYNFVECKSSNCPMNSPKKDQVILINLLSISSLCTLMTFTKS